MPNQHLNPPGVATPTGYTHVVSGQGRMVFIAGQTATAKDGSTVGEGDLARQAEQVFQNLKTCLEAAGASFSDVVKMTTFIVNYKPDDRAIYAAARQKAFAAGDPPASTLVGVQALARPDLMIEIEATAIVS
jgi:enamine deaminase RidA (YjgF/YER057c/UK114 family)